MASYPTSVKTFTTRSAGQTIGSAHINDLQDEVSAIEAGLLNGTAPLNSSNSTVAALVVTSGFSVTGGSTLSAAVHFAGSVNLTLANGDTSDLASSAFSTAFLVRLTGNSSGSTLTGLSGGTAGRMIVLRRATADVIGIKNDAGSSAGNRIQMKSNSDTNLNIMTLLYDTSSARWLEL